MQCTRVNRIARGSQDFTHRAQVAEESTCAISSVGKKAPREKSSQGVFVLSARNFERIIQPLIAFRFIPSRRISSALPITSDLTSVQWTFTYRSGRARCFATWFRQCQLGGAATRWQAAQVRQGTQGGGGNSKSKTYPGNNLSSRHIEATVSP